jgi:DNA-binding response OmpR family regulator
MERRILVVEDQKDIADLIAMHLRDLGHAVDCVHDGGQGYEAARSGRYDLVVLDGMLPVRDGLDVLRALRMDRIETPVLMLTARSSEIDRVLGLELGADDYLTKPFSIPELQARVKAILRRSERQAQAPEATQKLSLAN